MVSAQISSSSSEHDGINETQVVLNVYDLTPVNSYTYWFGFGIFHSGIEGFFTHLSIFLVFAFYFCFFMCFLCFRDLGLRLFLALFANV